MAFKKLVILAAVLGVAGHASAQIISQTIYEQTFDHPVGVNGDVYFADAPVYNGINDGTSSNGIATGASFAGNGNSLNGQISAGKIGLVPQSGPYLLIEQTVITVPDHTGVVFSTAGTTINLKPNSNYQLSYYLGAQTLLTPPEILTSINGTILGTVIPTTAGSLVKYSFNYNSGNSTTAVIQLSNEEADGDGNDFGIDTIQLSLLSAGFSARGLTPNQSGIATHLGGALGADSEALVAALAADPAGLGRSLRLPSPSKFGHFASTTAFNNDSFETQDMDTYLAGQRGGQGGSFMGGNGQIDASGLTVNDPNVDPSLAMVHSRLLAWNAPSGVADVASPSLGGIEMKDMKSLRQEEPTDPLNVFVRGNVVLAQGFSQADIPHFDDNTESVIVGADYRVSKNFLVGLTGAYAHTDATLDNSNSSATIDSYTPGIYASYANEGWYLNAIGRYSYNSYTEDRAIDFLHQHADGGTDGNEGVANLDGGYDFHHGALTYGPTSGIQYVHLTVNGYSEANSDANLNVREDQSDSLRSRVGGTVRYAFTSSRMTFTPHLTASWVHEFMDQSRGINAQLSNFAGGDFVVRTQNASDNFALVDTGLDAQIDRSFTLFADYLLQAGQDNYFGQSVQAGVKMKF